MYPLERVLFIFVCMSPVCPQLLQFTVAGLSRWHSPPLLLLSAQTQTGPNNEGSEKRGKKTERVNDRTEGDASPKIAGTYAQILSTNTQIVGTLVRTKPGLWSLTCSSVAAMSISFTPNVNNRNRKSIAATVFEVS